MAERRGTRLVEMARSDAFEGMPEFQCMRKFGRIRIKIFEYS